MPLSDAQFIARSMLPLPLVLGAMVRLSLASIANLESVTVFGSLCRTTAVSCFAYAVISHVPAVRFPLNS